MAGGKDARQWPLPSCGVSADVESLLTWFLSLDPVWIYASAGAIAFTENIFPPFPSDVIVVAAGSLAAAGRVDPIILLLTTTAGSTIGFMAMFAIGAWIGEHILQNRKVSFIPAEQVQKVERWFQRWGYGVVVANRFLAGTRAVVSFFAGMAELSLIRSSLLSFVSALCWNAILVYTGRALGSNWRDITLYLEAYGETVTSIIIAGLIVAGVIWYLRGRRTMPGSSGGAS